jgi:hypothetical protein
VLLPPHPPPHPPHVSMSVPLNTTQYWDIINLTCAAVCCMTPHVLLSHDPVCADVTPPPAGVHE